MTVKPPGTAFENRLFAAGCLTVAGIDEVGRGAWAGPLSVGVVVVTRDTLRKLPRGVHDSKLLSPIARERLFEPLAQRVSAFAIGHASPEECDRLGMTAAQRLATARALGNLATEPDALIIDGSYNFTDRADAVRLVKADRLCRVVAAASVLAKVTRDRLMVSLAPTYPQYGLERNKGYASREHRQAVNRHGISSIHRKSWSFAQEFAGEHAYPAEFNGAESARL